MYLVTSFNDSIDEVSEHDCSINLLGNGGQSARVAIDNG